jgi:hypothetical protein
MRDKIDFTDKELYYLALSLESHINSRDTFWTKKSKMIFHKLAKKIILEGMKRKDPKSILHPIVDFTDHKYNI